MKFLAGRKLQAPNHYLFTLDSSGICLKSNCVLLCSDFQLLFMGFATQFMVNGLSVYVKWATGRMSKNVTSTHRFPYITHIYICPSSLLSQRIYLVKAGSVTTMCCSGLEPSAANNGLVARQDQTPVEDFCP